MNRTTQETIIPIPPEVSAFAEEQGVSAELPAVLEMTRRIFPEARLSVVVEDDPEIANDRHIVIIAEGVKMTVEQALEADWAWCREIFAFCPAPLVCVFRLGMELVE